MPVAAPRAAAKRPRKAPAKPRAAKPRAAKPGAAKPRAMSLADVRAFLEALAKGNPDFFAKYVRNPQAVNQSSRMAASPDYDDQTIAALRAYFSTFAAGGP